MQKIDIVLESVVEHIDKLFEANGGVTGIPTGFIDLDRMISGLQRGDLIIVAGRPSMGKTSFSMNIAEYVALAQGLPVAVFSMEMSAGEWVRRMISSVGRVNHHRLRTGRLTEDDWTKLVYSVEKISESDIFIEDEPYYIDELCVHVRELNNQCGKLGLIIVDYIQLMASETSGENRATEISEISRNLKALAREMDCPVIALSQVNRSVDNRPNKRPMRRDLREWRVSSKDVDLILFIYRDEVYNPDSDEKGMAEIIIGKQRNGPIGTVRLTFNGQFTKFDNYANALHNSYGT